MNICKEQIEKQANDFQFERTQDKTYRQKNTRINVLIDNKPAGYAVYRDDPAKRENTTALSELYINPNFRNKGVASKLISEVRNDNKGKSIVLRALPYKDKGLELDDLKEFYKKHGFANEDGVSQKEKKSSNIMLLKKANYYKEQIEKQARLHDDIEFNPFQKRVIDNPSNSMIVAHDVGSGKTLSSIAKFEKMREKGLANKALVVTPASLRHNFGNDGVKKFTDSKYNIVGNMGEISKGTGHAPSKDSDYNIISYEMFRKNPEAILRDTGADTVIADEMHKLRNNDTATLDSFKSTRDKYKNFIGLTGSIVNNHIPDMYNLVDLASKGEHHLGATSKDFDKSYLKRSTSPKYKGLKENRVPVTGFNNKKRLQGDLAKYVDYASVDDVRPMAKIPLKETHTEKVPLSKEQAKYYKQLIKNDPKLREIIKQKRLETLKDDEISKAFNRMIEARKLVNSVGSVVPGISLKESSRLSPKTNKMLSDMQEHLKGTPDGQAILLTNMINGGADVLEAGLKDRGISYGKFIGKGNKGVTEETRQNDVNDYNARKKRVMLISGAGAEGLSLGDTTWEGALDGHYNPERMKQMEARGIRAFGQSERAEGERKVKVNRYLSTMPKTLGLFKSPYRTPDEVIYEIADNKAKQNQLLYNLLDENNKKMRPKESLIQKIKNKFSS